LKAKGVHKPRLYYAQHKHTKSYKTTTLSGISSNTYRSLYNISLQLEKSNQISSKIYIQTRFQVNIKKFPWKTNYFLILKTKNMISPSLYIYIEDN